MLDIRWKQRFTNLEKAVNLLKELDEYDLNELTNLQKEGFIQRFEVAFELAWKTLKDFLEYQGHEVLSSPRPVIKEAFSAGIIENGDTFIEMVGDRNKMSHTYDEDEFNLIFAKTVNLFAPALFELCDYFKNQF